MYHTHIVLVRSHYPGNLGSILRAMKNFGVCHLSLVSPRFELDHPDIKKMACGAENLLSRIKRHSHLSEALALSHLVVGSTRRIRFQKNRRHWHPCELRKWIKGQPARSRVSLVFGPEEAGLTNDELSLCQKIVTIPTRQDFPSINLAQSVMILLYELSQLKGDGNLLKSSHQQKQATHRQLESFYRHWEEVLLGIGFLDPQNPYRIMNQFRELLSRAQPTMREVGLLRALCRKVLWASKT